MVTLIEHGDVYAPEPLGRQAVLALDGRIAIVGEADRRAVDALGVEVEVIDADGCVVTPGLIDPHEHLLGGSGEGGFGLQSPMITVAELLEAGITTVVGCLGVDTTMKTLPGLLARVKALREAGLSAWMWTGGYNVPPTTVTGTVRNDILFIEEVFGCGEVAIADTRATDPAPRELARLVTDANVGGLLSRKAGLTHFHVGAGERRLGCLREILDPTRFQVEPGWLYATHINRSEALVDEAAELARRGIAVDIDVVDGRLAEWLECYRRYDGPADRLTFSSDASLTGPGNLFDEVRACVLEHRLPLEDVLPHVTRNTADILQLRAKGAVEGGIFGEEQPEGGAPWGKEIVGPAAS